MINLFRLTLDFNAGTSQYPAREKVMRWKYRVKAYCLKRCIASIAVYNTPLTAWNVRPPFLLLRCGDCAYVPWVVSELWHWFVFAVNKAVFGLHYLRHTSPLLFSGTVFACPPVATPYTQLRTYNWTGKEKFQLEFTLKLKTTLQWI